MMTKHFVKIIMTGFFAFGSAFAAPSEIALSYRYKNALTSQLETGERYFGVDPQSNFVSDPMIEKTLLVITMAKSLSSWLKNFEAACVLNPNEQDQPSEQPNEVCATTRLAVAENVLTEIGNYANAVQNIPSSLSDEKLYEVLDLFRKLAQNMKDYQEPPFVDFPVPDYASAPIPGMTAPSAGARLGVTTGGAQDFGFVRKLINDGLIPSAQNFDTKGFLAEFALSPSLPCDKLICVEPIYKVDAANKKLFVQIAMGTNVRESDFKRKPLNLALVIDVSGSMSATDGTEKSRLEWAKDAAIKTVAELNNLDVLSIVVFDTDSEVLVPATTIDSEQSKTDIIAKISALETKNSTNLFAGIKSAYELVSDFAASHGGHENRLILISDAGINTGVVDEATTLNLVSDYAAEGIGLTAIGLGEDFNQDFILGITKSLGGNYLYVHSGKDMFRYFDSFDFLISPVAYQFKVNLDLLNLEATFVDAYGIPVANQEIPSEIIYVQTLFFTKQGGGAMVIEYDLK